MALSPALKQVVLVALSWLFVAACGIGAFFYYPEMKAVTAMLLGLPTPASIAAVEPRSPEHSQPASAPSADSSLRGTVELRAGQNGHFSASASINGRAVDVMVDTGATIVALTWQDAQRAGIFVRPGDFTGRVNTANGVARVAPVTIDQISIGDITVRDVQGVVTEDGLLTTTLLGMSFLGKLSRAEMRKGSLVLEE